ncbi:hypothetical protein GKO32_37330 [Amycolatopsis sp. RM579]|uniref:Uncharacterized protein n=2 Tax=Amycolatopsis pithecellobii TaxID=664692 RepID=A0A6N7ZCX0_9PSEU|nr:hypothetical protein [Amycolatopsis pithecellobii]
MLSWGAIAYGAALSAIVAVVLALLAARERRPVTLAVVAVGAIAGPVAWNAILRSTKAHQFFINAPIAVFPIARNAQLARTERTTRAHGTRNSRPHNAQLAPFRSPAYAPR